MVVKQNYDEDMPRSDAETLLRSYRDSYSYEMDELRKAQPIILRDRLYGLGLNKPDAITEEFCDAIAQTFIMYLAESDQTAEKLLRG